MTPVALWHIAFGPRPPITRPISLVIWALFGNAKDGPYGWLDRDETKPDPDWTATARWWLRNPAHNLTHYLLAIPFKRQRVLIGAPDKSPAFWPAPRHVLLAINGGPFFAIQFSKVEAYAGFRPKAVDGRQVGVLGFALRGRRQ